MSARTVKVALIGNASVGKTSIIDRYLNNSFNPNVAASIGVDLSQRSLTIDGQVVNIVLCDTAGQEVYESLVPVFIRSVDVVLLCFDPRDATFELGLDRWNKAVDDVGSFPKYLVVTKHDLWPGDGELLDLAHRDALCRRYNAAKMYLTSSLTGEGIEEMFEDIARQFLQGGAKRPDHVDLKPRDTGDRAGGCCT